MASTDAFIAPVKNTAFRMPAGPFFKTDGTIITTWAGMDSEISKDGGNYTDCTNEATEIQTSGTGFLDLTGTETNCDSFWVKITITNTDAVPFVAYFATQRAGGYLLSNVAQINSQTTSAAGSVTFPATIASTTNITAGTITTATNLTNAPTAGDFTATMKTSLNAATPAVTVSDKTGFFLATTQAFNNTGTWTGNIVGTLSTLTTYTGNTPQTGDSFARIGATGSGLTSLAPSATALSTAVWTSGVAARIDADISSRLATSGYTAPANSTIALIAAAVVKIQAATYDSASLSGSTLTLSNAATMVVTSTGRVTT